MQNVYIFREREREREEGQMTGPTITTKNIPYGNKSTHQRLVRELPSIYLDTQVKRQWGKLLVRYFAVLVLVDAAR